MACRAKDLASQPLSTTMSNGRTGRVRHVGGDGPGRPPKIALAYDASACGNNAPGDGWLASLNRVGGQHSCVVLRPSPILSTRLSLLSGADVASLGASGGVPEEVQNISLVRETGDLTVDRLTKVGAGGAVVARGLLLLLAGASSLARGRQRFRSAKRARRPVEVLLLLLLLLARRGCATTVSKPSGLAAVRVSANGGADWTDEPTPIVPATVTFVAPHLWAAEWGYSAAGGDGNGGSSTVETSVELLLHGAPVTHLSQLNLLPDVALVCRFVGSASDDSAVVTPETPAAVVDGTLALCPTPTHRFAADDDDVENGTLSAKVAFVARDDGYVSGRIYHMELVAALPSSAQVFPRNEALTCRFRAASGGGAVAARTVRATCINASLILDCEASPATVGEGIVDLIVSMNRVGWTEGDRAVTAITPGAGRLEGDTRVVLHGTGFSSFYATAAANSSGDAALTGLSSLSSFGLASNNEAANMLRHCRFGQVDVRIDAEPECETPAVHEPSTVKGEPHTKRRVDIGGEPSRSSTSTSCRPSSRSSQSRARRAAGWPSRSRAQASPTPPTSPCALRPPRPATAQRRTPVGPPEACLSTCPRRSSQRACRRRSRRRARRGRAWAAALCRPS